MPEATPEPATPAKATPGASGAVSRLRAVRARALARLAPPPKIDTASWIEANVVLPGDVSDTPGAMTLFPYQRGIAEACDDPGIDRITWQKCARIGASTLMVGVVASYARNNPRNIMVVQPTQDDARDFVISTVDPVFAASPALRGLMVQQEKKRDTIQSRAFPGGWFKCVNAVGRNMRRKFVHVLMLDETDGYLPSPDGNILKLAEDRTRTARDRLIFQASTPTDEATSTIARAYAESDMRIYEIPCPGCGEYFEPRFKDVKWDKTPEGDHLPDTAHLICPACGSVIEESQKAALVAAGRWRPTAPHVTGHAGFKCSALISTIEHARWGQIVREFLAAKDDPSLLKVWTNTLLGDTWADRGGEGLDEHALAKRAEPFGLGAVPEDVRILVAGVDVQAYGLEVLSVGFSETQIFVLDYRTLHGDPHGDEVWQDLDGFIKQRPAHPWGGALRFDAVAVDSGDGNLTAKVYSFTRPRHGRLVISTKGYAGNRTLIKKGDKPGLYVIGADTGKTRVHDLLGEKDKLRFSADLEPRFYEELCSERKVVEYKAGFAKARWEKDTGARNEALDSMVMAISARTIVSVDMTARANELRNIASAPVMPSVFRSKWMEGNRG